MTTRILPILSAAALAVLFAACSTTPDEQKPAAGVESRSPAAPAPEVSARKPAPTVDLTARSRDGSAALKDPNNILS